MLKTVWKPREEIQISLEGCKSAAILSCGICANLCGTGGPKGAKLMAELARSMGVSPLFADCISPCCSPPVVAQSLQHHAKSMKNADALVMVSCAAGVKAAALCAGPVRVVAALDSTGGAPLGADDNLVVHTPCAACGHCVLTFTAGICPVTGCPKKRKYGPCNKAPQDGGPCVVQPERPCVWAEIYRRANVNGLERLKQLQAKEAAPAYVHNGPPPLPGFLRAGAAHVMARSKHFSWITHLIR